jgi:hypothetical protein
MCVVAAAHPAMYLDQTEENLLTVFPPEELEFDLRGRSDVEENGVFMYIDVGEIKATLNVAKATQQLGVRLGASRWLFTTVLPKHNPAGIRLVGRLFVRKCTREQARLDGDALSTAREQWGFSMYLHSFSLRSPLNSSYSRL